MSAIHIHRVPTEVVGTVVGEPRWCFGCRKRRGGIYSFHSPIESGYYGPHWSYACDGCHRDCRLGFGWEWLEGTAGPTQSDGPYCARAADAVSQVLSPHKGAGIIRCQLTLVLTLLFLTVFVSVAAASVGPKATTSPLGVSPFWSAVQRCEEPVTGWTTSGSSYEGGLGFFVTTWEAWAKALGSVRS